MKKHLLLLAAVLFAGYISAQNYKFRLEYIQSSDYLDYTEFHYNKDNKLFWNYVITPDSPYNLEIVDTLRYDDRGNIIKIETFQMLNGDWFPCCIVDYTYDDNNNRTSRTNYNNFGSGFEIQGIYTYTYDENNRLVYHEMTLAGFMFERCNYQYNTGGNIVEQLFEQYESWTGNWVNSSKTTWEYNTDGYISRINYLFWENNTWDLSNHTLITYDAKGNCHSRTYYSGSTIADRIVYTYDLNGPIEQVIMPEHPEPFYREADQYKNRPLSYTWETVNDNGQLIYVCDFNFSYEDVNITGVKGNANDNFISIFPNPAHESVTVNVPGLKKVEITDMKGTCVRTADAAGNQLRIGIQDLPAGVYFVRAFDGKQWMTTKLSVN